MGRRKPHFKATRPNKEAWKLISAALMAPIAIGSALSSGNQTRTRRTRTKSYSSAGISSYNSVQSLSSYSCDINYIKGEGFVLCVKDLYGNIITDETVLNRIKRTPQYKSALQSVMNETKREIDEETKAYTEIYKQTPLIISKANIEKELEQLSLKQITANPYNVVAPSSNDIKQHLSDIADRTFPSNKPTKQDIEQALKNDAKNKIPWYKAISRILYVKNNLERSLNEAITKWQKEKENFINSYVNTHFEETFKEWYTLWETDKNEYDVTERQRVEKTNKQYQQEYDEKEEQYNNILDGDKDYVNNELDKLLQMIELPVDFNVEYSYDLDQGLVCLDIDLPEIEDIPTEKASFLASGKVSIKTKTKTEIAFDYSSCVCGLAFYLAGLIFNISTNIEYIRIAGFTQRLQSKTGHIGDDYVYVVLFDRENFAKLNVHSIIPQDAITAFPHNMNISKNYALKTINSNSEIKG